MHIFLSNFHKRMCEIFLCVFPFEFKAKAMKIVKW